MTAFRQRAQAVRSEGVGILYIGKTCGLQPLIHAARRREGGVRALACCPVSWDLGRRRLWRRDHAGKSGKGTALRDYLIDRLLAEIPYTQAERAQA